MSVPESQRGEGKFEVLLKTRELASYTINICSNEKNFKPQYRDALTNKIVEVATDIHLKCWSANNIKLDLDNCGSRLIDQNKAVQLCNDLLALIQISQKVFHLSTKRIKYWGSLVLECKDLIKRWKASDRKRLDDFLYKG